MYLRNLFYLFLLVFIGFFQTLNLYGQSKDKFYLIDTSNFYQLTSRERLLLKEELTKAHSEKNDTARMILVHDMYSNMNDNDVWIEYVKWIEKEMDRKKIKKRYPKFYDQLMGYMLNDYGYYYSQLGSLSEALSYYQKSLYLKQKNGEESLAANTMCNIALVYYNQRNYTESYKMLEDAVAIFRRIKDTSGIASSLYNLGTYYHNDKKYDEAIKLYTEAYQLQYLVGDTMRVANCYDHIGVSWEEKGNLDSALIYCTKALEIHEKLQYKPGLTAALDHLADIYYYKGQKDIAIKLSERSLELSKEIKFIERIRNASENLYILYKENNNPARALLMHELFIEMRDSIDNEESRREVAKKLFEFEYNQKAAGDSIQRQKEREITDAHIAQQEAEISLKRNQQYFLFGGLGLVLIFAFFMFNRFKVTQRQKNVIELQKTEVEQQKNVIEHQKHEVEEKNKEITDSINYAKRIQEAILPSRYSLVENLKNGFVLYKPKDIVAGDFYWLEKVDDTIFFAAADCTGHGVPGAMVSVVCSNALSKTLLEEGITDPGKILDRTRELVIEKFSKSGNDVKDGMDISLVSLEFGVSSSELKLETNNPKPVTMKWAGANNPLWIIRNESNEVEEIKPNKQPIGKYAEPTPFTTQHIEIKKGDSFYIFTDGFSDQFGGLGEGVSGSGKKFKAANFKKLLLSIQNEEMDQQKELINSAFENWRGELEQVDDVCVIGVRL